MTPEIRIPAQACYETARMHWAEPGPDWKDLDRDDKKVWNDVANAAVFATLHCDTMDHLSGLRVGQKVVKTEGDYTYEGQIAVIFAKKSGAVRLVVENGDGVLMIMEPKKVKPA